MSFGNNLRNIRTINEKTQEEVAAALKVELETYKAWEDDTSKPSVEQLIEISKQFNVSTDELLNEYKGEEHHKRKKIRITRNEEDELIGKICGIIMILATMAFFIGGAIWTLWHPMWIVFPVGGIVCAIISSMFKRDKSWTSRLCTLIMALTVPAYLVMGFVGGWWHPGWVIFPVAALVCGLLGTIFNKD